MAFPEDEYTPHGYLDIPEHTRNLTPLGVLRSFDAGFRWHYPAYAGSYGGGRETYRAGLRVCLNDALELPEFDRAVAPYHSRNLIRFDLQRGEGRAEVEFHTVGQHALRARVDVSDASRVSLFVEYTRTLSASGEWGESGLVGRAYDGALVLQGFEDGEAFVLWTSQPASDIGVTADSDEARSWAEGEAPGLPDSGFATVLGEMRSRVSLYGVVGLASGDGSVDVILARGRTLSEAMQRLDRARREANAEHTRKLAEDGTFWAGAPRLEGDWPDRWRRGLMYDLETLRMMVKAPIGAYSHPWDAMQIQAPRTVLGESALDALLLGYADPQLAQAVLLGTFANASEPNVPCSREDGSYNMVSADGTVCGTGPEWGYPWLVVEWLYLLRPDRRWLEDLYPYLASYLDWWLAHRRDSEGWLVHACSWESGQDLSPRFGDQPLGGGHPTWSVRPVDLHAAFAHAATVMAQLARELNRAWDIPKWSEIASEFGDRTGRLWNGSRYSDWNTSADSFTSIEDAMQLAPLALGIAENDTVEVLRAVARKIDPDSIVWPVFAWTVVEAAMVADLPDKAAEIALAICERAYGFRDARNAVEGCSLPGIVCEYWPPSGNCGGEGYGWGAFTAHLLIHTLIGFSPEMEGFHVRPNLPTEWRRKGTRYGLRTRCRGVELSLAIEPMGNQDLIVSANSLSRQIRWGEIVRYGWEELTTVIRSGSY